MNTHRRALAILKTELSEIKTQTHRTLGQAACLDVFTSSAELTIASSSYLLQKSTINRAQVGLISCNFNFNSTTSHQCTDWKMANLSSSHSPQFGKNDMLNQISLN